MREIAITGETIRLGQLLKLAGLAGSGGEARRVLAELEALVNGEREPRRGRQLRAGDEVRLGGHELRVIAAGTPGEDPPRST